MHKISIPQSVIDHIIHARGREHVFETFDPAKTALLVVDMQNGFMIEEVGHSVCPMAREIVPNINRLADALRNAGGMVVWIQNAATEETLQSWSVRVEMDGPERTRKRLESMLPGSKGYELWAGLTPARGDLFVQKTRFSAFIQGSSNLAEVLRERGIDTVLITGTVTGVCCESTARDAMMCNFKTIMITDGNAAMTDEDHNASLAGFYLTFGDVMPTDTVIEFLRRNASKGLAAAE